MEEKQYTINDLTPAQQTLLKALIEGKSKAEAYREAYPKSKIQDPTRQVIKMIDNEGGNFPRFSQVYAQARAESIKRAEKELEKSIMKRTELLAMLSDIARASISDKGKLSTGKGQEELVDMPPSMHDRLKALALLGKHLGIFEENLNLTFGNNPFADLTTEDLRKLVSALDDHA